MARVFSQPQEKTLEFLRRIEEKKASQEQRVQARIDAEIPKFLHWALKLLATGMVRGKQRHDSRQGAQGELSVQLRLWHHLPNAWAIINDVVLEYKVGEYSQIDHIAVGPAGIFLIETKAWDGAVLLKNDQCFRKEAGKWRKTHSPIQQNKTHVSRFSQWYNLHELPHPLPTVEPIVVFTRTIWLVSEQCSMPVLTPKQAASYLTRFSGDRPLDEAMVDRIVAKILNAEPLPAAKTPDTPERRSPRINKPLPPAPDNWTTDTRIREGTDKDGRKYVRIQGTREDAKRVWEQYGKPGKLAVDRFDKGTFFFYHD